MARQAGFVGFPSDTAVALALALTPLIVINVSYALAVSAGHVASCIPYVDGCTSTSSTGRVIPGRLVFLPGMLATALLGALFWWRCALRLGGTGSRAGTALPWLGMIAALGLAIYAISVGQPHEHYVLLRRAGVTGFVLVSYAAMLVLVVAWRRAAATSNAGTRALIALCVVLPALFAAGEVGKEFGLPRHAVNNLVEWNSIVLLSVYFAVAGRYLFSKSSGRPASPRE